MFCRLLIASALIGAIVMVAAAQDNSAKLRDEQKVTFRRVFGAESEKTMEPHVTKFHLSKLKRLQAEAKAKNIQLTEDDESQRDMLEFLVGVSHLNEENCHGDHLAEREMLGGFMKSYKNVVEYLHYYTQQQIELCKSLGLEVNI